MGHAPQNRTRWPTRRGSARSSEPAATEDDLLFSCLSVHHDHGERRGHRDHDANAPIVADRVTALLACMTASTAAGASTRGVYLNTKFDADG